MPESFLVIVKCMTFNHHAYIEDAMNGFCMQKTDFPYLCIVMDDCSTDGEQEVIKKYVAEYFNSITNEETDDYVLNLCQHKTNENCCFAVFYLKYNHYSIKKTKVPYYSKWQDTCKYVSICEGDDYWIDERKLQMQADALEKHPECTIAFCKVNMVSVSKEEIGCTIPYKNHIKNQIVNLYDYTKEEFYVQHWTFHTSSFFIKSEYCTATSTQRKDFFEQFPYGDMPTLLWALLFGNGIYINEIFSCYRVLSGGYNSYVRANPDFALRQDKKLINALKYFDRYTHKKYHKYIALRVLKSEFNNEIRQGKNKYRLFLQPKYHKFLFRAIYQKIKHLSKIVLNIGCSKK